MVPQQAWPDGLVWAYSHKPMRAWKSRPSSFEDPQIKCSRLFYRYWNIDETKENISKRIATYEHIFIRGSCGNFSAKTSTTILRLPWLPLIAKTVSCSSFSGRWYDVNVDKWHNNVWRVSLFFLLFKVIWSEIVRRHGSVRMNIALTQISIY